MPKGNAVLPAHEVPARGSANGFDGALFDIEDEMPNALQTEYGADPKLARDKSRPDRVACDADMMFDAVCCRLARLVEHGVAPQAQAGVLECVAALGQLHEDIIEERARHRRCEQDLVAARAALAVARVDIAIHLATAHRDAVRQPAAGSAGGPVAISS